MKLIANESTVRLAPTTTTTTTMTSSFGSDLDDDAAVAWFVPRRPISSTTLSSSSVLDGIGFKVFLKGFKQHDRILEGVLKKENIVSFVF